MSSPPNKDLNILIDSYDTKDCRLLNFLLSFLEVLTIGSIHTSIQI